MRGGAELIRDRAGHERRDDAKRPRHVVDCLPYETRLAMLEGLHRYDRIIVGAYSDRSGGVCPMLAAHRCGGRTDFRASRAPGTASRARSVVRDVLASARCARSSSRSRRASGASRSCRAEITQLAEAPQAAPARARPDRRPARGLLADAIPALGRIPRGRRGGPEADSRRSPDGQMTATASATSSSTSPKQAEALSAPGWRLGKTGHERGWIGVATRRRADPRAFLCLHSPELPGDADIGRLAREIRITW